MADKRVDVSAAGCLGTLFTFMGIFLLGSSLFNQIQGFSEDGAGFGYTGALIPGLVLLFIGGSFRRRARAGKPDGGQVQIPLKVPPQNPPAQPAAPPKTATPLKSATPPKPKTPPRTAPPIVEIPELPTVEEVHRPGELPAVEDLSLEDFEPDKPMSSEERIRLAKEKYRKNP